MGNERENATEAPRLRVAAGEITAVNVDDIMTRLDEAIASGAERVVLDLEGVRAMDSVALGVCIAAHLRLAKAGGGLEMVNVTKRIRELMAAMRLEDHFDLQP